MKKKKERPCHNCHQLPQHHNTMPNGNLDCELECLPVPLQDLYYITSNVHESDPMRQYLTYVPMDNLEYLEFEYQKEKDETPTRESLR